MEEIKLNVWVATLEGGAIEDSLTLQIPEVLSIKERSQFIEERVRAWAFDQIEFGFRQLNEK